MHSKVPTSEILTTDVLVIGGGMAGCRAAIAAADYGGSVVLATKMPLNNGGASTFPVAEMAGYNAGDPDIPGDVEKHYEDIVNAGQGMANPILARILAENAPGTIVELEKWGVVFEKEGDGYYIFKSCFATSPRTHVIRGHGEPIVKAMSGQIQLRSNINVADDLTVLELDVRDGRCCGAWAIKTDGTFAHISAGAVVIASGGATQVFTRNLNPKDVSGDGYALAYDAGAELINMEFMQSGIGFSHPIVNMFNGYIWAAHPKLHNNVNEQFLGKYLPKGMTQEHVMDEHRRHFPFSSSDDSKYLEVGIQKEIRAGGGSPNRGIYADLRHLTDDYIRSINDDCGLHHMWYIARDYMREKGVDLNSQIVEIAVFAHAINGGVNIDESASSTLPGLYAAGEAAGGPHGADRLGGNMMVTCQVFGKIAGENAAKWAAQNKAATYSNMQPSEKIMQILHKRLDNEILIKELQEINQNNLLVCRSEESLSRVLQFTENAAHELETAKTQDGIDTDNFRLYAMLLSSRLMAKAALQRKESRGSHFREDYPQKDSLESKPVVQKRG